MTPHEAQTSFGFTDAAAFGFVPEARGLDNAHALQRAVDGGGTVVVSRPGIYRISDTVLVGSHTSLIFGNNVILEKTDEAGAFSHVILNKGALTKSCDERIVIQGLELRVNSVDVRKFKVYGLRGQLAFFHVRDVRISGFRCYDLGDEQFGIHVCTFEDLVIEDVVVKGLKDGVHLGRGKRFMIRDAVFETGDDAIALNAHDYSVSNPEIGWIEDGVIENIRDLENSAKNDGYFCRILAGAWVDWQEGMMVRRSDTVVSEGRLYRVHSEPDGSLYRSVTRPTHEAGSVTLDGINWSAVQDDVLYTACVRNVTFRNISLLMPRVSFSIHFDNDIYSRSYYPGAQIPKQEQLVLENVRVLHHAPLDFLRVATPVDVITMSQCSLRNNPIRFLDCSELNEYGETHVNLIGCVFRHAGEMEVVTNEVPEKELTFSTSATVELSDAFSAVATSGPGRIVVNSDLTGLNRRTE